ncbi:MAG: hypothetical protein PF638_11720 [Candidatus Delongbacteria bacterium]|jgi:cell division protein FtsW (lipid II flippase)|nr:hypothetical protein [Candidatus Delongbacteria bacterium]
MKDTKNKFLAYVIMIGTFGLVVAGVIKKHHNFEEGSLKAKNLKINNILWAIIYFFFFIMIVTAMFDGFIINRAAMFPYLTRIALGLLVYILISDGIISLIKDSGISGDASK